MNILKRHLLFTIAMAAFSGAVGAQDLGQIRDGLGGAAGGMPSLPGSQGQGSLGAAGSLGSLGSLESIQPGSLGNAAGIIGYCVKNNYLGGSDAIPVKDQLMGKLAASSGQPSTMFDRPVASCTASTVSSTVATRAMPATRRARRPSHAR